MMKFLDRLFGKADVDVSPEPILAPDRKDEKMADEIKQLKLGKFYTALEEYLGRPLEDEERKLALQSIDPDAFSNMVGEEIGHIARTIAEGFAWPRVNETEWKPGQDPFSPMAPISRQINFERGLFEFLGRAPSDQELARARQEFLREDDSTKKAFASMVGEEVTHYAKLLAGRLGWASAQEVAEMDRIDAQMANAAK